MDKTTIKIILDIVAIIVFVLAIYFNVVSWNEGFKSGYNVCISKVLGFNVSIIW